MQNPVLLSLYRVIGISAFAVGHAWAQEGGAEVCDQTCQATRDAQDPTAAVNGVFFDNTIGFGPVSDNTLYDIQVQPIVTAVQSDWGDVVVRGIVTILGVPTPAPDGELETDFGVSDTIVQAFYIPPSDGAFKFGFGPQVSLATHTEDEVQGADWGAGVAGGGFGFAGPLSYGAVVNHLWGDDEFNQTTVQPIVFYNVKDSPLGDWFIGYNSEITYNWSTDENQWTVPVGATVGKTFILPSKDSATVNFGAYDLVESGSNGNEWQLQFSVNILFN
ncbi:MAG: hypothetical protein AAFR65_06130 [Pseudomonadota bacterium]